MLGKLSQPVAGRLSQWWTPPVGSTNVPHRRLVKDISGVQGLNSCFSPNHRHNLNFNKFGRKLATFQAAAAHSSSVMFLGCCGCTGSALPIDWVSMSVSAGCLVSHLDWRVEFALSGMWPDLLFVDYGLSLKTLQHLRRVFQTRSLVCVCLALGCQLHLLEWGVQLCTALMLLSAQPALCVLVPERPLGLLVVPFHNPSFLCRQWNSKILPWHKWASGVGERQQHPGFTPWGLDVTSR